MCSGTRRLLGTNVIEDMVRYGGSEAFAYCTGHLALKRVFALGWRNEVMIGGYECRCIYSI